MAQSRKGRQVVILKLSDGTSAKFYGTEQIKGDVTVTGITVKTRAPVLRHKWGKVGESLWECSVCGTEGAGYDPEQFVSPVCPGPAKEGCHA